MEIQSTLYKLLGQNTILIPIPIGTKKPRIKWSKIKLEETKTPEYQETLSKSNIAVVQGGPSNNLVSIDIDNQEALEELLKLNPWLDSTFKTKAHRGCNFWLRMTGNYPRLTTFKGWGEFRSTGGYTLVHGKHPTGVPYQITNYVKPLQISWDEIKWPKHLTNTNPPTSTFNSSVKTEICKTKNCNTKNYNPINYSSVSLYNKKGIIEKIRLSKVSAENLERWKQQNPNLKWAYEIYIERYFQPSEGNRNSFIVDAAKKLICAVALDVAERLLVAFYDINAAFFNDDRLQHQKESKAMLINMEKTFIEQLPQEEQQIYIELQKREKDTFRIMRDLTKRDDSDCPIGEFFLSCRTLALRLELKDMQASRILSSFEKYGIIRIKIKGQQRTRGRQSKATKYEWMLP